MIVYTQLTPDDIESQHHPDLISAAKDGSTDAAKLLLGEAAVYIQHGVAIPEPLGSYVGDMLYEIAKAETNLDANLALNLKKPRGKNQYTHMDKHYLVCLEVQLEYLSTGRYSSSREDGACAIVAEKYGYKDSDSVRNLFENNHEKWQIKRESKDSLVKLIATSKRLLHL